MHFSASRRLGLSGLLFVVVFMVIVNAEDEQQKETANDEIAKEESGEAVVVTLTEDDFKDFISREPIVLVEFYAPWCGHCKQLAPEYEKAAKVLKANDPPIVLAKVDATKETALAKEYGVSGYPTLKVFKSGTSIDYDGSREADGIVQYMKEKADPKWKPPPSAVVALTQDSFDEFVLKHELSLVEFYAPWCGHCKQLAPEYEKSAKDLKELSPTIPLAKVDATEETELAKRFDVTGYPTLKIFRKGESFEYNGPRNHPDIVDYMITQSGKAAKLIETLKQLKKSLKDDEMTVVGMFTSVDSEAYKLYQKSGNDLREDYPFFYTNDPEIMKKYKVEKDSVLAIMPKLFTSKYEKAYYTLAIAEETQVTDLVGFYGKHSIPLVGELTRSNKGTKYSSRPLCILYVPVDWSHAYREMTNSWREKLLPIADRFKLIMTFAMADDEKMGDDLKSFGLDDSGSDFNIGCYGTDGSKYPMDELDEWDEDEVEQFLDKVQQGKAKPFLKSQIPPKRQTTPVAVVVGKTFKDIVFDTTKDVLIEMYAPWCGHCKKFEPEYKKMANEFSASEKNLLFAKMDATANDAAVQYSVQGFPTIYMAPAGRKDAPVRYEGNRDPDDLKKFIKDNADVSFKQKDEL